MMGSRITGNPLTFVIQTRRAGVSKSLLTCSPACLNFQFLLTFPGILKIVQVAVGGICENLLLNQGIVMSSTIGSSYLTLLTTCIASVSTVALLLFCYLISFSTLRLVRSSLFELLFNLTAAVSYCSSSIFMYIAVSVYTLPLYLISFGFLSFPALSATYMLGFFLSLVHALDCYQSYKAYKGVA